MKAPWWKTAVFYQIYPRSFYDTNHDGIGDLRGIIEKLDYLNNGTDQSLGIDALWISPFYPSPMKDFGYDISDYTDIDPRFGTMDDFKELLEQAHKRNIRIIIDLVINHTSDQHPWFLESKKDKQNEKADWYIWHDGKNGKKPNNWFAGFELKSAWWWNEDRQQYYLGTFTRHQPEVNWRNEHLKKAMYDVIRFWLDLGVDGFRMDVVNWYIKDQQWRSNPWKISFNPPDAQEHIYDRNRPETHDICKEIREITDSYDGDRMLVGEIFVNNTKQAATYYGNNDELHFAFNFAFLFQKWNPAAFQKAIRAWEENIPSDCWPNYTLSNHDQPRHYGRYSKHGHQLQRAKVAAAMLLTLRGTPFIYYGEEIGMTNTKISRSQLQDPLGKKAWPFHPGRDQARTPMQWNDSAYAGFSEQQPWLPVNPDYQNTNVAHQTYNSQSLLHWYRSLISLRKQHETLQCGDYQPLIENPKHVMAFERTLNGNTIIVLLNFSNSTQTPRFTKEPRGEWQVLLGSKQSIDDPIASFTLAPYEILIAQSIAKN